MKQTKVHQRPDTRPQRCIWTFGWSINCYLIRNGLHGRVAVKKPFLRKGNREKKAELCQMTQEVDWKSVAAGLMEGWILPRARTSTLLKQRGIMLAENGTKRQPTSKEELWNVFQEAWRTIPEDYLKKWLKACLRGFRLWWRIKVFIKKERLALSSLEQVYLIDWICCFYLNK